MSLTIAAAADAAAVGRVGRVDGAAVANALDAEGHAVIRGLVDDASLRELDALVAAAGDRWVPMAASSGVGDELVPDAGVEGSAIDALRRALQAPLCGIAAAWEDALGASTRKAASPGSRPIARFADRGDVHATFTRLRTGGHHALRRSDDEAALPLHVVVLLREPGVDFEGGELVLTEQRPRRQSRPIVVPLRQGDAAVVAAGRRPVHGAQGVYAATVRHAVSRVRRGERLALELRFTTDVR